MAIPEAAVETLKIPSSTNLPSECECSAKTNCAMPTTINIEPKTRAVIAAVNSGVSDQEQTQQSCDDSGENAPCEMSFDIGGYTLRSHCILLAFTFLDFRSEVLFEVQAGHGVGCFFRELGFPGGECAGMLCFHLDLWATPLDPPRRIDCRWKSLGPRGRLGPRGGPSLTLRMTLKNKANNTTTYSRIALQIALSTTKQLLAAARDCT